MKCQAFRQQLVIELLDERLDSGTIEPQPELGDTAFEKFLIAQ